MKKYFLLSVFVFALRAGTALSTDSLVRFTLYGDVLVTMDYPSGFSPSEETRIILYALPNGSTTVQTMGKKMEPGDDWRFDIQHIRAQTDFIRDKMNGKNLVVVYLENSSRSWPLWKTRHLQYISEVQHIVDTIYHIFPPRNSSLCLNGHSGGGRFIFSYLDGVKRIPGYIKRIVFLDSDYGYTEKYGKQIGHWLKSRESSLQVFAYEDSLVELDGKRIVSDTGGTWYRTHRMLEDLSRSFHLNLVENDSLVVYQSPRHRIGFFLKPNPEKKILHTVQVEKNGFIHSILAGTPYESSGYRYFGKRAYEVR
jgi:hypothetical protein